MRNGRANTPQTGVSLLFKVQKTFFYIRHFYYSGVLKHSCVCALMNSCCSGIIQSCEQHKPHVLSHNAERLMISHIISLSVL